VAIADVAMEAAQKLAAQYGAKASPVDEILDDRSIDAVLIATSMATGKAVLCEKPVDLSLDRALQC
jgi:myo-inositol 2-dehydrogenase / D-chiro-inositol 1-dehydrogenase